MSFLCVVIGSMVDTDIQEPLIDSEWFNMAQSMHTHTRQATQKYKKGSAWCSMDPCWDQSGWCHEIFTTQSYPNISHSFCWRTLRLRLFFGAFTEV